MDSDQSNRIAPLSELDDYKVAEGDPDVRGWDVTTDDGEKVGEVDELLVDTAALRVLYLAVKLDRDFAPDGDRRVLVPIGAARLDDEEDRVLVTGIAASQFTSLPVYERDAFDMDAESSPGDDEVPVSTAEGSSRRVTRSEEELTTSKRMRQVGEISLRKRVETEHVREPVTRRREEVEVERRPVSEARSGEVEIGEDEIRIPVIEEEIIVEKRPVVKEEIVVKTRVVEETENVEADLRRERVHIDESGARRGEREDRA